MFYSKVIFQLYYSLYIFFRFRRYFLHSDLFFTDSNRNYSVSSHFSHFQSFKTFTYFWPYSPVPFRAKSPKVEKLKMNPKVSNLFVLNLKNSKMYSKKCFVKKKITCIFTLHIFQFQVFSFSFGFFFSFKCFFFFHSDLFFQFQIFFFRLVFFFASKTFKFFPVSSVG